MKLLVRIYALIAACIWGVFTQTTTVLSATIDCAQYKAYQTQLEYLVGQHEAELGILRDPFLVAFTQQEANDVFNGLLHRSDGLFCVNSPLFRIQQELGHPQSQEFNQELVDDIIHDAHEVLSGPAETRDLQSSLLALKSTRDYLNRFPICPIENTGEQQAKPGKKESEQNKQQSQQKPQQQQRQKPQQQGQQQQGQQQQRQKPQQQGQQQQGQQQQRQKPQQQGQQQQGGQQQQQSDDSDEQYPEFGDDYKPHTKDTSGAGDGKTKSKTIIAEVDFKTRYFGTNIFTQIVRNNPKPFQKSDRLEQYYRALIGNRQVAEQKMMIVRPLGKQRVPLFLPPGYRPATFTLPNDAIIELDARGSYYLSMNAPLDHVAVPLVPIQHHSLTDYQKGILTEHVGFDESEWPAAVQSSILHVYKPGDDTATIAKAVEKHLSTAYLYSRDARPETDPVDALQAGAFQCDMAAYLMVSILRDVYAIPCRVVAGFRAKMRAGSHEKSYLLEGDPGHVWVEVFHDNTWNVYDPTPTKKDKEDENKDEKSEFRDVPPEDQQQPSESQDKQKGSSLGDLVEKTKEKLDKDAPNGKAASDDGKEAGKEQKKEEGKPGEEEAKKQDEKKLDELPELHDSLAHVLQEQGPDTNPLRKESLRLLLLEALNPLKESNDASSRLSMIKNVFTQFDEQKSRLISEALEQHKDAHYAMKEWLQQLRGALFVQDINHTYQDLIRMIKILSFYKNIIDVDEIRSLVSDVAHELVKIIDVLYPLKDAAAADMALLDDVKKNSPLLLWETLQSMYGLSAIGPNMPTHALAEALRGGKHNDHLLLSALYPYTNFILDASLKSGSMLVKTWLRDGQKRGSDLLPTDRLEDWNHAISADHRYDLLENIRRASAFVLTKRKKVLIPQPNENKEAKRISIVGFDVSGSMAGQNAEFQAALLAAFVCRALEDISPSGVHRHTVLLVPFDHDVHEAIKINDSKQALNLIKDHQSILANQGGGTDIQKFLIQAMSLIAEAQDRKNPFEIANIILMSDGQSGVNYDEIEKARKLIHRDTPLQTMFIAIGESNPDLKKFAMDSKKMGAQKEGFYKEFSSGDISKIVDDAHSIDMKKYDSYYYSSQTPDHISPQADDYLLAAYKKLESLAIHIQSRMSGQGLSYRQNLALFGRNHPKEMYSTRSLESWILQARQMMANTAYAPAFREDRILNFVLNNIVDNFRKITGVEPTDLTQYENEEMVHWLNNPSDAQSSRGS